MKNFINQKMGIPKLLENHDSNFSYFDVASI